MVTSLLTFEAAEQKEQRNTQAELLAIIVALLTWFCFGYAIAFGTNPEAVDVQFAGFTHGWFGDFSGGLSTEALTDEGNPIATPSTYDFSVMFNQRRFFVFFSYLVLGSNIATSSIADRVKLPSLIYFVMI